MHMWLCLVHASFLEVSRKEPFICSTPVSCHKWLKQRLKIFQALALIEAARLESCGIGKREDSGQRPVGCKQPVPSRACERSLCLGL